MSVVPFIDSSWEMASIAAASGLVFHALASMMTIYTFTIVQGIYRRISMSWPLQEFRCCIDVNDNQPRPNCVCYLNSSKSSGSSRTGDITTLTMTIPFPLQEALRDSITSGSFVDTKFWVFSKRGSKSDRVGEPKALFVNGHVAKRVPRLASRVDFLSYLTCLN